MSMRVDPTLVNEIKKFGKGDWNACYHCGNCTAVCSLTEENILFPRKDIRYLQMGLRKKLAYSNEPWLCYYCGDCSETCPRDANPGELLMSLRRYLTSVYDWTGISGILYKSLTALIIGLIFVAAGIIGIGIIKKFDSDAIMKFGHNFEQITMAIVFGLILIPNIFRMFYFTTIKRKINVPLFSYIKGFLDLFVHMFTQKSSLKCEDPIRWMEHFFVVIGYIALLICIVFLDWFNTDNTLLIWFGYIVGGLVFVFTFDFIISRIKKKKEITKFSHHSDWMFVIWLFLMALTAFIVRLFIDLDILGNNTWLYILHLVIMAQWAILMVPFGKWMHFLYRSFAMYFANLKKAELKKSLS